MPPCVIVADEIDLIRLGSQVVLDAHPEWQRAPSCATLEDLLACLSQTQPDVVVFSDRLSPDDDAVSIAEALRVQRPEARLIVSSGLAEGLYIHDLLMNGMMGFLYRADDLQICLPQAVRAVLRGRPYLSPTASAEHLTRMASALHSRPLDAETREMLRRLARGEHISLIAREMGISRRRAYWLRQKLRQRFGAVTNEHLISRAVAEGFSYSDG